MVDHRSKSVKNLHDWRRTIICILLGAFLFLTVFCSGAQAVEQRRSGVQISPLSVEKEVQPGEELSVPVRIFNPLPYEQVVRPVFKDFVVHGAGDVRFLDYSSPRYTISRWADFKRQEISLASHEERMLVVKVFVPQEASVGGHFGAFFAEVRGVGKAPSKDAYQIRQRVASGVLFFLSVLGEDADDGGWVGELESFGVEGGYQIGSVFFSRGPLAFDALFRNKGIFHQTVWGGLEIRLFGKEQVKTAHLREKKVLPETYTAYHEEWSPRLPVARYDAELEVLSGRRGEKVERRTISFWVVNLRWGWAVLIVLLLLGIWVLRRKFFGKDGEDQQRRV